jgi:ribosomal protein L37AE/L43A
MTARDILTEPRTDAVQASIPACSICDDTGVISMDGRLWPCPYCRPDEARRSAAKVRFATREATS